MQKISSLSNPLIQYLKTLHQSKNRYLQKQFLIEGWYLVEEALKHKVVVKIFVLDSEISNFQFLLTTKIEIFLVSQIVLKKITQTVSAQPIVALCNFQHQQLDDLESLNNVILLDDIQDPSNLGAILRSACAFGITKIFLSHNSVDFYNHKVISASKGAIFNIAFQYCDLVTLIASLKANHFHLYGTFLHEKKEPQNLATIEFHQKNAFLFGNEGRGINSTLRALVDENFVIKTTDKVESLNLAASVAIVVYTLFIKSKK